MPKEKKNRQDKYEEKVSFDGSLDDLMKISVRHAEIKKMNTLDNRESKYQALYDQLDNYVQEHNIGEDLISIASLSHRKDTLKMDFIISATTHDIIKIKEFITFAEEQGKQYGFKKVETNIS